MIEPRQHRIVLSVAASDEEVNASPDTVPELVCFTFRGRPVEAPSGATVAAALIASGVTSFGYRSSNGEPRGPFCMMGCCFDCLVQIDGTPNLQACKVTVQDGMNVQPMTKRLKVSGHGQE